MLSDLTPEEFAAMQLALHMAQQSGDASPPGEISYRELAVWFMTTPQDIKNEELCALEKLRHHLHV
jgi:hypothetical protein